MATQMPDDDLPREPDPPERATDVDKQDPATPDSHPEPEASEVESARLLANQARSELGAEGFVLARGGLQRGFHAAPARPRRIGG